MTDSSPSKERRQGAVYPLGALPPTTSAHAAPPLPPPRPQMDIYSYDRAPPASQRGELNEFGYPMHPQNSNSASRRPLPGPPPLPTLPYGNGSASSRNLPQPPSVSMQSSASYQARLPIGDHPARLSNGDYSAPLPPARPAGRALPALPPSASAPTSRHPSNNYASYASSPPPPPARPRPLPTPSSLHSATSVPLGPQTPSQTSFYDSPTSVLSTPSYPFNSPQDARSSSTSSQRLTSFSDSTSRSTSLSHRTSQETGLTSLDSGMPPDTGPPIRSGTPTQHSWQLHPPPPISVDTFSGEHLRVAGNSSAGGYDASQPGTPRVIPGLSLSHQRSFLQEPTTEDRLSFPEADPFRSPAMVSRQSSTTTASTGIGGGRGADGVAEWQQTQFPPSHQRHSSTNSSLYPPSRSTRQTSELSPSWNTQSRPPANWVRQKLLLHRAETGGDDFYDDYDEDDLPGASGEYEDDGEEEGEEEINGIRFFNPAFLSESALQLRDRVVRGKHVKAGIAWVGSFTGRDLVTTIQSFLPPHTRDSPSDRRFALIMAQSLQNQLWFVEVDWDIKPMRDSSEDVFRFMGEMEGMGAGGDALTGELPSGVMTMATKCYSPSCRGDGKCYSPRCPSRTSPESFLGRKGVVARATTPTTSAVAVEQGDWKSDVDPLILAGMSEAQIKRQNIIRQAITAEEQYAADLTAMETLFIIPLQTADPPIISPPQRLDWVVREIFSNVLELRETCRRLIENFRIRQREQFPLILTVGDRFLVAASEFRNIYPQYTGNMPQAEKVLREEMEENPEFRLFIERVSRQNDRRMDIKYLIARPSAQLQRYPAVLEAILKSTADDDPDKEFLVEALASVQSLSAMSQLKLFHASKGRGPAGKIQWFDLVPEAQKQAMDKKEQKRQMIIWELIQGEMEYVADLETIETLFIDGLRNADTPIIETLRLDLFIDDAFHNYRSILDVHRVLLARLQERQMEQHPNFGMISDLIFDAVLNWRDAYMEYVPHYPIAKAKIGEEQQRNPRFAEFLEVCQRDVASGRQGIIHFAYRPVPRLLRYPLLLEGILETLKATGPEDHPDIDMIPQILELIADLGKATQKGVAVTESKLELTGFQQSLDGGRFGYRAVKDLDLLNPMRELIHKGKVFRQPEGSLGGSWSELFVLLFDNYFVLVKHARQSRNSERLTKTKYYINRRVSLALHLAALIHKESQPIPLELLSLGNFSDPAQTRSLGLLRGLRGGGGGGNHDTETADRGPAQDNRTVYPFTFTFIGQGQLGGQYTLWTDSDAARSEWKEKLQHAKVLRNEVNDAGKVFDMTPISLDTFFMAPNYSAYPADSPYQGRVTCSVPFVTADGRSLIAVGCQTGVWIGIRNQPKSLRKVLHVTDVTQCAVLEEFGLFLVLANKILLAYHLEVLVPSDNLAQPKVGQQRFSGFKDIVFFSVGQLAGRTLVICMRRKGMDSIFKVLEPVLTRTVERRPLAFLQNARPEWSRNYKDFFIPTEALHVHFLKAKLAIVCAKGFEIMDLTDLKGGPIPIFDPVKAREKPAIAELSRRCESAKPLGMYRSTEAEFLLCYDTFGIYVDRHGEPNRDFQAIEWEGRPDSIAFHPPYLLLVSAPFIEIRHIDNAKLLQIHTGSDIRCTWDGTGGMARPPVDTPGPKGYGQETSSQEPRIHICQRPDDYKRTKQGIPQHVFELTPTLLLNNPLLNPVHTHDSNYFPPAPPMRNRPSSVITTSSQGYGYNYNGNGNGNGNGSTHGWGG
ncbi:RHO1 GDP-GTP exchange protein 1/2, partial [Tremellales sp. Uapishka_1]